MSPRAKLLADEAEVVARAQRGDRRAFEQIYRAYARTLYGYVLVPMLGDGDDAEDCLRETFIAANRALASYAYKDTGIYGWLKVLAKNKARDLLRASGRRQRLRGAFAEQEEIEREELRAKIETVLDELNPRYAMVLRLRLLEDKPREECARVLDVKIGTLDVLLFRACRSFRQACEKRGMALTGDWTGEV
jgi:RNA polymerase sigma factor (sigma-70 family)